MADFEYTKVDPKRLYTAANNIAESLSALERAFTSINDALQGTLQPTWTGAASTAFFEQYKTDAGSFVLHTKSLSVLNERLREASGIYDNADSTVGDMVSNLKI